MRAKLTVAGVDATRMEVLIEAFRLIERTPEIQPRGAGAASR
jgi:hypothetical protein